MIVYPMRVLRLLLRFCWQCVWSGVTTAQRILGGGSISAGLARFPFRPMSPAGAAVLGALVTLTPGSTLVAIDLSRREMLLHLLDLQGSERTFAQIRRDFEADVAALFPERPAC